MNPKVTVITVCLNNKNGLERTIESVTSQTFHDFEYIIIDGGSTDGSIDVINMYGDRITHWVSEMDDGIYHAMNKGIGLARGDYCLFLNAGDFLCNKNVLNEVFLKEFTNDLIYGNLMYDNGVEINYLKQPEELTFSYLFNKYLFHPSTFIKRKLFQRIGSYNEEMRIAADYEFMFKAIIICEATTQYIPMPISQHDNKGISSRPENFALVMNERSEVHKKYLPKMVIDEMNDNDSLINLSGLKYFNSLKYHPMRKKLIYFLLDKF